LLRHTRILLASSICLFAGAAAASDDSVTAWRVFVADHAEPKVTVIDAIDGQSIGEITTDGPATLHRNASGDGVYAVQGSANIVAAISSGLAFEDHGDHGDLRVEAPKLTGATIGGDYPVHFVEHGGQWAAFFDKEGVARVFSDRAALAGSVDLREVSAGVPHHGLVIPFGDHDLVSVAHPDDPSRLPIGIRVQDQAGQQVGDVSDCPDLHGEAASGNLIAIACETGLLIVVSEAGAAKITHIPYGETLPEGKSTTLVGGRGMQYFLGNFGPDRVVIIDPMAGEEARFRLLDLPTRRVHFAVDPIRPRFAYVFTEDGTLHQLDVIRAELTGSLRLTEPYSMDGHWSDPRPRIAVAGDSVFVSDPLKGVLHQIEAAGFEKTGEITVEGSPFNMVAVGGSGRSHEHD
jgi:hypothetical protein